MQESGFDMYARVVKFIFPNEFSKQGAEAILDKLVPDRAKNYGLAFRLVLNPTAEQRIGIQVFKTEKEAKKFKNDFTTKKLNEVRQAGARIEVFEGPVSQFDYLLGRE